jgi:hypothetical protein
MITKDITQKTNSKFEISKFFEDCSVEDVPILWSYLVDQISKDEEKFV